MQQGSKYNASFQWYCNVFEDFFGVFLKEGREHPLVTLWFFATMLSAGYAGVLLGGMQDDIPISSDDIPISFLDAINKDVICVVTNITNSV